MGLYLRVKKGGIANLTACVKKEWSRQDQRLNYLATFFPERWNRLPKAEKERHTLGKCNESALYHKSEQQAFPGLMFSLGKSLAQCACAPMKQNESEPTATTHGRQSRGGRASHGLPTFAADFTFTSKTF